MNVLLIYTAKFPYHVFNDIVAVVARTVNCSRYCHHFGSEIAMSKKKCVWCLLFVFRRNKRFQKGPNLSLLLCTWNKYVVNIIKLKQTTLGKESDQTYLLKSVALHLFLSAPQPPTLLFLQQRATRHNSASSASFTSLLETVSLSTLPGLKTSVSQAKWFPRGESKRHLWIQMPCALARRGERERVEGQGGRGGQSGGGEVKRGD